MAKYFLIKETVFTLEFTDSEDARVFDNKAYNEFEYCGCIDTEGNLTVKATFENEADAENFLSFVQETLGEPAEPKLKKKGQGHEDL